MLKGKYTKLGVLVFALLLICSMVLVGGCGSQGESQENIANEENSGATGDQSAEKNDITIGIVVKTMGNPFFREIAYGAIEAGKEFGVNVIPLATAKEGEIDEQIKICEDLLQKDVDALVVTPQHSSGIAPAVLEAHRAGVPFIAVDTNVEGEEVDCFIGMDNIEAGQIIAEYVAEKMGGQGNAVILEGMAGASTSIERSEGFRRGFAKYPGITVVADQNADFRQDKAQQVMADILQAHSDIKGVVCCNDLMALGAMVSLEEAGYKLGGPDGVVIGSYDISLPILSEVKNGKVAVTGYHWGKLYGYWGVQMALMKINGQPIPRRITSPHSEITPENVDEFIKFAEEFNNYKFPNM